jgi:hypothetical protein
MHHFSVIHPPLSSVIPAEAGSQVHHSFGWIPATNSGDGGKKKNV